MNAAIPGGADRIGVLSHAEIPIVPIPVRCECGKSLQAKDEFAGRKVKCSKCGKILRIPAAADRGNPAVTPTVALTAPAPVQANEAPAPAKVIARPAPVVAKPVSPAPLAKPVPTSGRARPHPWEDRSLMQTPTPWRPGDEERFQAGIRPEREGLSCWEKLAVGALLVAGATGVVAAIVFLK